MFYLLTPQIYILSRIWYKYWFTSCRLCKESNLSKLTLNSRSTLWRTAGYGWRVEMYSIYHCIHNRLETRTKKLTLCEDPTSSPSPNFLLEFIH